MDLIRLNPFPVVPTTGIASLVTDQLADYSLHALFFQRGGGAFTTAMLTGLRIRLNGKDLVNGLTGPQLVDFNEYDGLVDTANFNPYFFGDPTARTIRGEHLGDVDLSIYRAPLEVEVTIAGATTPTLQAWALVGPPKVNMGIGFSIQEAAAFRAMIRTVLSPNAAVTRQAFPISLGAGAGALIRKIALYHAQLTSVEFTKQSIKKWDDVATAVNSAVAQQYARVPQAGLYMLDRIVDGNIGEAEPTVQNDGRPWNLQLNLTTAAADTITAFADVLTNHAAL